MQRLHPFPGNQVENGHNQVNQDNSFLSGIKQRLLSFIFQSIWNEETDQTTVGISLFTSCYLLGLKSIEEVYLNYFGMLS